MSTPFDLPTTSFQPPCQSPRRPTFWRQSRSSSIRQGDRSESSRSSLPSIYMGQATGVSECPRMRSGERNPRAQYLRLRGSISGGSSTGGAPTTEGLTEEVVTDPTIALETKEAVGTCIWCRSTIFADEEEPESNEGKLLQLTVRLHPGCVAAWEEDQHTVTMTGKPSSKAVGVMDGSLSQASLSQASLDSHTQEKGGQQTPNQAKVMQYLASASRVTPAGSLISAHFGGVHSGLAICTAAEQDEMYRQQQKSLKEQERKQATLREERKLARESKKQEYEREGDIPIKPNPPRCDSTSSRTSSFIRGLPLVLTERPLLRVDPSDVQEADVEYEIGDNNWEPVLWSIRAQNITAGSEPYWTLQHCRIIPKTL